MKRGGKVPRKRLYVKDLPPSESLQDIARGLPPESWQQITWREGIKGPLRSRFARIVVWLADGLDTLAAVVSGSQLKPGRLVLNTCEPRRASLNAQSWLRMC